MSELQIVSDDGRTMTAELVGNGDLRPVCQEAAALATRMQRTVLFEFNTIPLVVAPGREVKSLIREYYELFETRHREGVAQREYEKHAPCRERIVRLEGLLRRAISLPAGNAQAWFSLAKEVANELGEEEQP